jgi:hypothetical protein
MLLSTQLLLLFFLHAVDFPDVLDATDVPFVFGVPANFGFPAVLLFFAKVPAVTGVLAVVSSLLLL